MSLKLTLEGDQCSYNGADKALKRYQCSLKEYYGALIRISTLPKIMTWSVD